jgi:hypothetical protein
MADGRCLCRRQLLLVRDATLSRDHFPTIQRNGFDSHARVPVHVSLFYRKVRMPRVVIYMRRF